MADVEAIVELNRREDVHLPMNVDTLAEFLLC